jgi:hypothetical protein
VRSASYVALRSINASGLLEGNRSCSGRRPAARKVDCYYHPSGSFEFCGRCSTTTAVSSSTRELSLRTNALRSSCDSELVAAVAGRDDLLARFSRLGWGNEA